MPLFNNLCFAFRERVPTLGLATTICGTGFAVAAVGFGGAGTGEEHFLVAGGAGADPDFAHCVGWERGERVSVGWVLLVGFGRKGR